MCAFLAHGSVRSVKARQSPRLSRTGLRRRAPSSTPSWLRLGRGYGSAGVEAEARALGMAAMALHVFAHNPGAIRAYERFGFHTTSLNMLKLLSS